MHGVELSHLEFCSPLRRVGRELAHIDTSVHIVCTRQLVLSSPSLNEFLAADLFRSINLLSYYVHVGVRHARAID